jgi:phosphatidylinositol-3-phosphatase
MSIAATHACSRAPRHALTLALVGVLLLGVNGCMSPMASSSTPGGSPLPLPHLDHVVVVVEENHSVAQILGAADAPYLTTLAQRGAIFTDSHAVAHPSEPNYLALFAGSTFGLSSDACPQSFAAPNLGSELLAAGLTFIGYSESLPHAGYTECDDGTPFDPLYARKHNPWVDFANVPASSNRPFSSFPTDFSQLPTVAFVVPNQQHDMHSGSVAAGDSWAQQHVDSYAQWAPSHNSLLIVTWDEDDGSASNHILTLFIGAHVKAGRYGETISHYDVLRTLEALAGLPFTTHAASAMTIADIWHL